MSIADKITALQTAKSNIASAITNKGGTVASGDGFSDFASDIATIPSGITPSGSISITTTSPVDVTNYATAQVVDADLVASNIKKDVNILGVLGTFEGGGSTFPVPYVTFTPEEDIAGDQTITLTHSLGYTPFIVVVFASQRSTTSPTFQIMSVTSPATVLTATNNSGTLRYVSSSVSITKTSNSISISTTSSSYYWRAGVTYYAMLIGQDVPLMLMPPSPGEEIERT